MWSWRRIGRGGRSGSSLDVNITYIHLLIIIIVIIICLCLWLILILILPLIFLDLDIGDAAQVGEGARDSFVYITTAIISIFILINNNRRKLLDLGWCDFGGWDWLQLVAAPAIATFFRLLPVLFVILRSQILIWLIYGTSDWASGKLFYALIVGAVIIQINIPRIRSILGRTMR